MKTYLKNLLKKRKTVIFLILISIWGFFLSRYKINQSPPCINADEAAFSYNSWSLLRTGKDEFGHFLPLRLTSFGDYKMPLLSYLNIPFIAIFGLNQSGIRIINSFILFIFCFLLFYLVKELFKDDTIAFLSVFLFVNNWGVQSMARQLHEALLSSFLVALTFFSLIKFQRTKNKFFLFSSFISFFILLFSYQSARIFGLFFIIVSFIWFLRRKINFKLPVILSLLMLVFLITDVVYQPTRVRNLLFINNPGFILKINEIRNQGGSKWLYNKLSFGIKEFFSNYFEYFSPNFLVSQGDSNSRFGDKNLSLITVIEYLFFLIGLFYLFKNKAKWRFSILSLLIISPIPAALSWAGISLTRSFFILIIVLITASYGFVEFFKEINHPYLKTISILGIFLIYFFLNFFSWDYYLNYYPKKLITKKSWQCGYQELVDYVKKNYYRFDEFYITKTSGPPYIFFLFFLNYLPEKFQSQAKLGLIDEYGFRQVEHFDKFYFNLDYPKNKNNIVIVGRPYEIPEDKTEKINLGEEDVFWIKEIK